MTDFGGKTSIFSHPVYLFLREFSLQDFRGGSPLSELFDVNYGLNLELNKLEKDSSGINFVSRTSKNNGVSARVKLKDGISPCQQLC
ncbi:hypothetical protein EQ902_16220 [Escherichia coli O157:H7]|nr:hypothetical protein EQ902_16220 [Escherichia coli O157:H7]